MYYKVSQELYLLDNRLRWRDNHPCIFILLFCQLSFRCEAHFGAHAAPAVYEGARLIDRAQD